MFQGDVHHYLLKFVRLQNILHIFMTSSTWNELYVDKERQRKIWSQVVTREAFLCQVWAESKSLSLKELGKPAEWTRRPLFSTVLSQGLMIHVLIHVLCWGSYFSCSQYCIIKALCALTFPLPLFDSFPLICFSISPLHNLGSFCLWMVSLVVCVLYSFPSYVLPLLNLSKMEISINIVVI